MKIKIASILNFLFAALSLVFGAIYFFRGSFMPYHGDAVMLEWPEVGQYIQALILALMRAVSGGFFVAAVVIVFLQIKFIQNRQKWIPVLILISGLIIEFTTLWATFLVSMNTPGRPPKYLAFIAIGILVIAYILNRTSLKKAGD